MFNETVLVYDETDKISEEFCDMFTKLGVNALKKTKTSDSYLN